MLSEANSLLDTDFTCPKRKIIQKRVKKRERYARMARIRYRKERNVPLAKCDYLPSPMKMMCSVPYYHFYMDFSVIEENGTLVANTSLINKIKLCNCITVIGDEGEEKGLALRLHDTADAIKTNWVEVVQEWESRNEPYWNNWASQIKKFSLDYEKFMTEYAKMLEEGSFDKKLNQKQFEFDSKRKQLMDSRSSCEARFRLEDNQIKCSELFYTKKFLEKRDYNIEEFSNQIFKKGFPNVHPRKNNSCLNIIEMVMENFSGIFVQDKEFPIQETVLITKNNRLKKTRFFCYMGGYFVKKLPEISLIFVFDEEDDEFENDEPDFMYAKVDSELVVKRDGELKEFLTKFYNEESLASFYDLEESFGVKSNSWKDDESQMMIEKVEVKQESDYTSPDSQSHAQGMKPIQIKIPNFLYPNYSHNLWALNHSFQSQFVSNIKIPNFQFDYYNTLFY